MIEIKVIGEKQNERIKKNSRFLSDDIKKSIRKSLTEIGRDLKKKTKSLIDEKPKHGRRYSRTINGSKITWTASAAGEAPAVVTGKLKNSIAYKMQSYNKVEIGSYDVNYAPFLEYKDIIALEGQGSAKILPRPYLSAALKSESNRLKQRIEEPLKIIKANMEK